MTDLFTILPPTLFKPLAAPGASVYVDVLLRLYEETQRHSQPLSRDFATAIVAETLAAPDALALTDEADDEPVAEAGLDEAQVVAAQTATLNQFRRAISRERVRRFAHELLRDRDEVRGAEIRLNGPDDLPLLIYLRTYGDGALDYRVEHLPDAAWIEHDGVSFRDFVLRRVDRSAHHTKLHEKT